MEGLLQITQLKSEIWFDTLRHQL